MWTGSESFNISCLENRFSKIKFDLSNTKYEFVENIGTGAYGVVCQAKNIKDNTYCAIKKIKNPFNHKITLIRTLREIKILNHFNHFNIISVNDIFIKDYINTKDIYVVLDLMESDLHKIIVSKQVLSDDHIRYFMYQLLCGVNYIHSASVIHRDLKPANILVNSNCHLKIADFGMARLIVPSAKYDSKFPGNSANINMTQYVMTRWYRAPELLMGHLPYNTKIDLWSCGCILAELYLKRPIFQGENMIHQLKEVIQKMGTPDSEYRMKVLPIVNSLIDAEGKLNPSPLNQLLPTAPKKVIDLLSHLLVYDPETRWSAMQTLKHIFFIKYKNPLKEEICKSKLDLSFETELNTAELLKEALMNDILTINLKVSTASSSSDSQSINFKKANENINKQIIYNCDPTEISESPPSSERTLSIDSGKELGYPVRYFEYNQKDQTDIIQNNRPKTVSQFTKNKLINSIKKSKDSSNRKIVTAAQRQKERKDRRLKLKHNRDIKKQTKIACQDLSDLDKSFLKKWEHLSAFSLKSTSTNQEYQKGEIDLRNFHGKSDLLNTTNDIKQSDEEVNEMSASLSAKLLLDVLIESDKNLTSVFNTNYGNNDNNNNNNINRKMNMNSNPTQSSEISQDGNLFLSNENIDLLLDLDIDCIEFDLNMLESYSADLCKD